MLSNPKLAKMQKFIAVAAALCVAAAAEIQSTPPRPHILFSLFDDWGWGDFSVHNSVSEVVTPNLASLVQQGILLNRHYVFKYCSPSRSALQSGRNPIHVNVLNDPIMFHNSADRIGGQQGIPVNMTTIASKLAQAGYSTHQVGKWNAGMAHARQTPVGRGYNSSLHYFDYDTFFWNNTIESCPTNSTSAVGKGASNKTMMTDLWDTNGPAKGENNSWTCSQSNQANGCIYQDYQFLQRVLAIVEPYGTLHVAEAPSDRSNIASLGEEALPPLFLFWAPHAPHDPYEVPQVYYDKFSSVDVETRRYYLAMVNLLDDMVGNVTAALQKAGLWDNLLWVGSSDNGGPVDPGWGGNNYPLRGGKASNWEGGIRVNAFASGGFIPPALRGTVQEGLIGIEDWYTTFCALAGVDPTDSEAASAGLPAVDGLDMSGLLLGTNSTSPRTEIIIGSGSNNDMKEGKTTVQGILRADGWKLVIGQLGSAFWQGPIYPNASGYGHGTVSCGDPSLPPSDPGHGTGCLFNVLQDPAEMDDVASENPDLVSALRARIAYYAAGVYSPDRGSDDGLACAVAFEKHGGFWGPFLD